MKGRSIIVSEFADGSGTIKGGAGGFSECRR